MGSKRKTILLAVFSIIAVLVIGVFFALWNPAPPPATPLPAPNGYDDFMKAAGLVQKQTIDFAKMTPADLRTLVDANSNALQIARAGLAEKSRVPPDFSQAYILSHASTLVQLRNLAYVFLAEGRLAELEGRTNAAAQSYFDAARLGINYRQGGNLIDALMGLAMESLGTRDLERVAPVLDAKTSAEFARQLEIAQSGQETWEQILQNEKRWSRNAYPGLSYRIAALFTFSQLKAARTQGKQKYDTQLNRTRKLTLDLAAHTFELDKGHRATNIADLVPAYLKTAPVDPITGKEMTLTP